MKHLRPSCAHCIYWAVEHSGNPSTAGHCHRYPPGIYVNPQSGTVVQKFPTTDRSHWCGEWNGDDSRLMEQVRQLAAQSAQQA